MEKPRVLLETNFDLSEKEKKAVRAGKDGCSCNAADLTDLGIRCANTAHEIGARSWSIFPLPQTRNAHPRVYVQFHNWSAMGLCNFEKPIGKTRYWWNADEKPVPVWLAPSDERAVRDDASLNHGRPFNPEE